MTTRCKRRTWPPQIAVVLMVALGLGGCHDGGARRDGARQSVSSLLRALVFGDARGACQNLTPAATHELAEDFGGSDCGPVAARTIRFVAKTRGERQALLGVEVLRALDVPLAPGPFRPRSGEARLRLLIRDPVLRARQAFDVRVRRARGHWAIDGGIAALFTIVPNGHGRNPGGHVSAVPPCVPGCR